MLEVRINPEIVTERYRFVRDDHGRWTKFLRSNLYAAAVINEGFIELLDSIVESRTSSQS